MLYTYNLSSRESEAGGSWIQGQSGLEGAGGIGQPCFKKQKHKNTKPKTNPINRLIQIFPPSDYHQFLCPSSFQFLWVVLCLPKYGQLLTFTQGWELNWEQGLHRYTQIKTRSMRRISFLTKIGNLDPNTGMPEGIHKIPCYWVMTF